MTNADISKRNLAGLTAGASWLLCIFLAVVGCNQSKFDDIRGDMAGDEGGDTAGGDDDDRPGSGAREDDEDVTCESDDDCLGGEMCHEGVCQMKRCQDGPYLSEPPLAGGLKFFLDRELVVADGASADGSYFIDGYAPESGSVEYPGSWNIGEQVVVDVVGGDFYGQNPEVFAYATQGNTHIRIGAVDGDVEMDVGFQPHALAAGDVDKDKKDEVVVLGQYGNYALCDVEEQTCNTGLIQNGNGKDVGVGDVDGDGVAEAVMLLDQNGTDLLFVVQFDDQDDYFEVAGHSLMKIDVGDPDGDGTDEIYGIEDDGVFNGAKLYAYSGAGGTIAELHSQEVDNASRDLSFADVDMDDSDELLVLRPNMVELLRGAEGTYSLSSEYTHQLQVSADALRIAASDFDGDSPRAHLMNEEPVMVPGPLLPTIVSYFPPFDSQFTDDKPTLLLGDTEQTGEEYRDSVSVEMGMDIGMSFNLFEVLKLGGGVKLGKAITETNIEGTRHNVGARVLASPDVGSFGQSYGVVVLSCGCFNAYYYQMDDPAGRMGDIDREEFVMVLPVDGTMTMWSTNRYNAMAEAVGNLPIVQPPSHKIGEPSSYPTGPQKPDGSPIPKEDLVFEDVPTFLISDVGQVGWWLSAAEYEINETARSQSISVNGELGLGPFQFGLNVGATTTQAYGVTVGSEVIFGGSTPGIVDDPETPEDEYLQNAFSFAAYAYKERYTGPDDEERAYYVLDFMVAEQ